MRRNDFEKYSCNYSLRKDWLFPYSQVEKDSRIIIYGAGDVGQSYMFQLRNNHFCEVICWVDRDYERYNELGLEVANPDGIQIIETYDYIVIAVSEKHVAMCINNRLLEMGAPQNKIVWNDNERFNFSGTVLDKRILMPIEENFARVFPESRSDYSVNEEQILKTELLSTAKRVDGMVIPRLVVELTPACSLRCKACNNLMYMYKNPGHLPVEDVLEDINTVVGSVDYVEILELIGGEPFLYPDISEVIDNVILNNSILGMEITTNGTIVPSSDVISSLCSPKTTVRISKYPNSRNFDKLVNTLEENDVRYEVLEGEWVDSGGHEKRNRSYEDNRDIYWKCPSAYHCKTLFKGKIFQCARAASLYDLGLDEGDVSYLDIYEARDLKHDIKKFWLKPSDGACDHCDVTDYWRIIKSGE